jgi:hypothetical protein
VRAIPYSVPAGNQGEFAVPFLAGRAQKIRDSVFAYISNPGDTMTTSSVEEWPTINGDQPPFWSIGTVQGCMIRTMKWKRLQREDPLPPDSSKFHTAV